jgi:cytochrome bd-type quinol oxidase subunit 2
MHLYTLPLVFALIGLILYVVLGGADFGAGLWPTRRRLSRLPQLWQCRF